MENKIKSFYDAVTGIFYKNYYGNIELEDLVTSWLEVINQGLIPENVKKFVINYKEATIQFSPKYAVDIADFYKKHDDIFAKSRIAMVMETPKQVVFPRLVEDENVNFTIRTFYTMEAAVEWLLE